MDAALPQPSPDDDQWADFDTLTRQHVQAELARDNKGRYAPADVEWMARRSVEFYAGVFVSIAQKVGAEVNFQNKRKPPDREIELRIRVRLPGSNPVVFENQADFNNWARENRPMLIIFARRANLAEAVPEVKSNLNARTRRSL